MEATQTTNDNWLLSKVFNLLGLDEIPSLQSAFNTAVDWADEPLDSLFEMGESIFRAFGNEELANKLENMQNGNWLARQFGLEIADAPGEEDTADVAETPIIKADPHFRM